MSETGTFKVNNDGSVDLPVDGKPVRYVKESDLLAIKGGATQKATEWENEKASFNTQLAEVNRLREETHSNFLREQAAKEQLVTKYQNYDTLQTRVGELETQIGSHKESVSKYEKELTDRIKASLATYGAVDEAIKDKTLDQLRNLEEAAKLFGNKGKPAKYDGGGPPGVTAESPTDRAKRVIAESEARRGKVIVSNVSAKV